MRVLVYKRTHNGDPSKEGCFGVHDCMGSVRKREFDAVVGVGGIGPEASAHGIDGRVNWIGIGPHKVFSPNRRGPLISFDHFLNFGTDGPDFRILAPRLANRIYSNNIRHVMDDLDEVEYEEIRQILQLAKHASPSDVVTASRIRKCRVARKRPQCPPRNRE